MLLITYNHDDDKAAAEEEAAAAGEDDEGNDDGHYWLITEQRSRTITVTQHKVFLYTLYTNYIVYRL